MQFEAFPGMVELVYKYGSMPLLLAVVAVLVKVNNRLNRDESLREDYPPHRHVNGKIIYPSEYPPAKIEELGKV